jgi:UPF0755 protein
VTDPRPSSGEDLPPARRWLIIGVSAVATLSGVILLGLVWILFAFFGDGPHSPSPRIVQLRSGASVSEIADTLEQSGAISSAPVFVIMSRLSGAGTRLKAGEYEIADGASLRSVMAQIEAGKVKRHFLTFPEGMTSANVAALLNRSDLLTGTAPTPSEGAVLPETYEITRGEDRAAVLQRMMDARDQLLTTLRRRQDLPLNSPDEAVTLASIVEKETAKVSERPRIAAVFVNRLQKGMRLESDPTIIYGISRGEPLGRPLRLSEVTSPTPYNTYVIDGLPPTPITNPGRAAIAAVLDPPYSSELFFVADGTGGHSFASTYEDHLRNVARWRDIERQAASTGKGSR